MVRSPYPHSGYWYTDKTIWIATQEDVTLDAVPVAANPQGAVSIRKTVLPGMAIPMLKIRRPNGRLIFNMEIATRR